MFGVLFSVIAGIFISIQSVFNTRVSDKIGLPETTLVVHAIGFIFALVFVLIFGGSGLKRIGEINKLYLLGGAFGVIIIFSIVKGITLLGATLTVGIVLIAQLVIAVLIDSFGLFGSPIIRFDYTKVIGILFMIVGIIIFKIKA